MGKKWKLTDFIFLGSIITADDDCSHKINRHLLLGSQAMTNVSSVVQSCLTLCQLMYCSTPGFPFLHHLPEFAQTHVHWVGDAIHLILCRPLLLLPSAFPSIRVFSTESALHTSGPKYWSFIFYISPSNENTGLISFNIDCFDLLAPQRTQESSLAPQFKGINSSLLSLLFGPTLTAIYDCWRNR